ncbi:MAG TPA: LLM class flavin-dependent oxidoreductase [Candidatus Acidoferrum sp.]|jgi:alkanesulfonate monooxygenase SsuD/methylene tetrahydromethanopterin reductase-like flavin-dependent oxidoreductase (luciferase family)|nr:LLM class flavin-dependent oxidoreductase [Candidatus Acidoferrum sp.]
MAKVGVMIEGQEGLNWDRWRLICHDAEALGFDSLRRSDHLFSVMGVVEREALECWTSLALAAEWTKTIEFGPMVSPLTFCPPALLARIAAAVDSLAGGRLILGVGAGWYEREHVENGIPFLTLGGRMDLLEDGIKTIRATWETANPKPPRGSIPLLMGGRGEKRALPMVAREAAEWNLSHMDLEEYGQKKKVLDAACRAIGRDPSSIRHSVMANFIIGRDRLEVRERALQLREIIPSLKGLDADEVIAKVREHGLAGTSEEVADQIVKYSKHGVELFMLQHFLLDDRDALKLLAEEVIPAVA